MAPSTKPVNPIPQSARKLLLLRLPQQLPGTIASSHVVLADATDDNNDWVQQQQEQDQLQEQLALQEMVQSEQAAEQQNEMAQQEAQQAIGEIPVVTAKGERIPLARLADVRWRTPGETGYYQPIVTGRLH